MSGKETIIIKTFEKPTWTCGIISKVNRYIMKSAENTQTLINYPDSNHIYTSEEVGQMSSDEFAKHEKEIDAQTRAFNGSMPTNGDLQREAIKLRLALNGNASN